MRYFVNRSQAINSREQLDHVHVTTYILGHQNPPRSSLPLLYLERNNSGQYKSVHITQSQDLLQIILGQNEILHFGFVQRVQRTNYTAPTVA